MRLSLKSLFSINPTSLTISTIVLAVVLFSAGIRFLDMVELKTYDLRFLSRGTLKPSHAVMLALIDEKSLDEEGRWPWPRSKIARLVDILSQGHRFRHRVFGAGRKLRNPAHRPVEQENPRSATPRQCISTVS